MNELPNQKGRQSVLGVKQPSPERDSRHKESDQR